MALEAFDDAIVIDACAISVTGWHERIERSGATALLSSPTWPRDDAAQAMRRIQAQHEMIRGEDRFRLVRSTEDIRSCKTDGKVGVILGAINTDMLGREVGLVEMFRDLGVLMFQFNYNERNYAADGCLENSNGGLSFFGRELVAAMNEHGVVIDLADSGIRSSLEALELSDKPCIFSHVNPRGRAIEQQRNLTDEQIKACAATGGVIAMPLHAPLCATVEGQWPTIEDYIGHIEYVVELAGIDHVALGSDSEAVPGTTSPELSMQMGEVGRMNIGAPNSIGSVSRAMGMSTARTKPLTYLEMANALQRGSWGVTGLETLEKLPDLGQALTDRGWSTEDLQKFLGGNLMRVFGQVWH